MMAALPETAAALPLAETDPYLESFRVKALNSRKNYLRALQKVRDRQRK